MSVASRCDWCGQFTRGHVVIQPDTETWKLEPNEPELLCRGCAAINNESARYTIAEKDVTQ